MNWPPISNTRLVVSGAAAAVPAVIRIRSGDRKMVRNMFETMDGDGDGDGDDDGGDDDGDDDGAIKIKIKKHIDNTCQY